MSNTGQLKKRLRSVRLSGQLASAMKTVSSAKYARMTALRNTFCNYEQGLEQILAACCAGSADEAPALPDGKTCYVILGHNRGLCGGYNATLHAYALSLLQSNPDALTVVCGKSAIAYFEGKDIPIAHKLLLPDVPGPGDCRELTELLCSIFAGGGIRSVQLVYQRFINTMTQEPSVMQLLPAREILPAKDLLMIPDRESLAQELKQRAMAATLYRAVADAATGAQAATLMAMRTAFENATETAAKLEHEINKQRQSAVTAGVIETSSGALQEGANDDGGWR